MSIVTSSDVVVSNDPTSGTIARRTFLTRTAVGVGGALVVGIELAPGTPWVEEIGRAHV